MVTAGPCEDLKVTLSAGRMGGPGALSRGVMCSDLCSDVPGCWVGVERSLRGGAAREQGAPLGSQERGAWLDQGSSRGRKRSILER